MDGRHEGTGWLRTRSAGASTGHYSFVVRRDRGRVQAEGQIQAELHVMIAARDDRHATLVLEDGTPLAIEILELEPELLTFHATGNLSSLIGH